MLKIEVNFPSNFWPSGRGTTIGFIHDKIEDIARNLMLPVFVDDGAEFVLLYFDGVGPVSICREEGEEVASVVADAALDPFKASAFLDEKASGKLKFDWPNR